jgi:flagella basal body P-ring formation protein FlgA
MLRTREIESRPLVQKGSAVFIIAESAQLKISVRGEALEHGDQGETIRVRNTSSRREVRAVVVDRKTVKVPF